MTDRFKKVTRPTTVNLIRRTTAISLVGITACSAMAQTLAPICHAKMSAPIEVASSHQRFVAGAEALPPITVGQGFDWPDGQLSALKTDEGLMFFSIDAGLHKRRFWNGEWVGNDNSGSVVRTIGTLDNPLGSAPPLD